MHVLEYDRAREEVELVVQEMQDSKELYQLQQDAIEARLAELAAAGSVGTSSSTPDQEAAEQLPAQPEAAAGAGNNGQPMEMVACMPLQYSSYEEGVAVYLQRQLQRVIQQRQGATNLFAEVLHRRQQLLGTCDAAAVVSAGDGVDDQVAAGMDLQEAQLQLQDGARAAMAAQLCDGLDDGPEDGMDGDL